MTLQWQAGRVGMRALRAGLASSLPPSPALLATARTTLSLQAGNPAKAATALAAYWLWLTYLSAGLGESEASKEVSNITSLVSSRVFHCTAFLHPNLCADVRLPAGSDGLAARVLPPHPAAVQAPGGDGPSPPQTHEETPRTLSRHTTALLIFLYCGAIKRFSINEPWTRHPQFSVLLL